MAVVSIIFLIFVKSVYSLFGEYCAFSLCLLQEKDLYAVVLHMMSLCNFLICRIMC